VILVAGKPKQSIDFFPHLLKESTTIKALEMLYQNNGYAVWFKLLEVLGNNSSTNYQYRAKTKEECKTLLDKFKIDGKLMSEILNTLCELDAIDIDKWKKERILYVPNLLNNIQKMKKKVNIKTNLVENDSKIEKPKADKTQYLEYVFLTNEEYEKLINRFSKELIEDKIESLNNWIGEKPNDKTRKKDSHYHTILNWFRMEEKKNKQNNINQPKKPQYKDLSNYKVN
jgi:cytolysin (calcineurin-like family phosphatase)